MKIAFPFEDNKICEHFGHCPGFEVYEIKDGKILGKEYLENPGHKPGVLPNFLADNGVTTIIVGGMGAGALNIFKERNVEVIMGAEGNIKENLEKYLSGNLISKQSVCHKHEHKHDCGNH